MVDKQSNEVLDGVLKILTDDILAGKSYNGELDADTPLLSSGVNLDSVAVLQLVVAIENQFGVKFKDTDMSIELFSSVGSLSKVIEHKLQADSP